MTTEQKHQSREIARAVLVGFARDIPPSFQFAFMIWPAGEPEAVTWSATGLPNDSARAARKVAETIEKQFQRPELQ